MSQHLRESCQPVFSIRPLQMRHFRTSAPSQTICSYKKRRSTHRLSCSSFSSALTYWAPSFYRPILSLPSPLASDEKVPGAPSALRGALSLLCQHCIAMRFSLHCVTLRACWVDNSPRIGGGGANTSCQERRARESSGTSPNTSPRPRQHLSIAERACCQV